MSSTTFKLVEWGSVFFIGIMVTLCFVTVFSTPVPADKLCENCSKIDQIGIAGSIGRLDFVAMALTILGIGLGFFAIFSFVAIRNDARDAAKLASKNYSEAENENLKKEIIQYIEDEMLQKSRPSHNPSTTTVGNATPVKDDL